MASALQDILVLIVVAMAAVYMLVRLRRMATGKNQCACGSKACGPSKAPCGGAVKGMGPGSLPLLPPTCNQGGSGCPKA